MDSTLKFDYDFENDTLYMFHDSLEYKSSLNMDGILIDFSKDRKIKGIELLDASKFLSEFLEKNITKEDVKSITEYILEIKKTKNLYHINLGMSFKDNSMINIPLSAPI